MTETSKKKNKQTPSNTTDGFFKDGVVLFDLGLTSKELTFILDTLEGHLEKMAMYEGYIKRKHGIVDENGEEIFA